MEDFRTKFAKQNLAKAKGKNLTDWEKKFIANMEQLIKSGNSLSQKQFNTLKKIADK